MTQQLQKPKGMLKVLTAGLLSTVILCLWGLVPGPPKPKDAQVPYRKGINPRIWGFHICGFTQWRIENSIFDPHLGILESGGSIHIPTSLIESV